MKIKEEPLEIKKEVEDEDDYLTVEGFMTCNDRTTEELPLGAVPTVCPPQQELNTSNERSLKRSNEDDPKNEGADQSANKRAKESTVSYHSTLCRTPIFTISLC